MESFIQYLLECLYVYVHTHGCFIANANINSIMKMYKKKSIKVKPKRIIMITSMWEILREYKI